MSAEFNAPLLAIASQFVGKYVPFNAITIEPISGIPGVAVTAVMDNGAAAFMGYDPAGRADETLRVIPSSALVKACRGIKTAERVLRIADDPGTSSPTRSGEVMTIRKTATQSVEALVSISSHDAPPLRRVIQAVGERWGQVQELSATQGRYDRGLVERGLSALECQESVAMAAWDGGPLRIQSEDGTRVVLVMPQTARELPPVPAWLGSFATSEPPALAAAELALADAHEQAASAAA